MDDYIAMSFPKLPPPISHLQKGENTMNVGKACFRKESNCSWLLFHSELSWENIDILCIRPPINGQNNLFLKVALLVLHFHSLYLHTMISQSRPAVTCIHRLVICVTVVSCVFLNVWQSDHLRGSPGMTTTVDDESQKWDEVLLNGCVEETIRYTPFDSNSMVTICMEVCISPH